MNFAKRIRVIIQAVTMLCKNISKKALFVTVFFLLAVSFTGCKFVSSHESKKSSPTARQNSESSEVSDNFTKPEIIGTIKSAEITESSGIVASRCNENVLWTHNDSGDGSFIYAIDERGKKLGTFRIPNAKNVDWEDIATRKSSAAECFLYIGDIGNNAVRRQKFEIYKVKEPTVTGETDSDKKNPLETENAEKIEFAYPDKSHDAETLLIHPASGDLYVLTKYLGSPAGVFKLSADYDSNKVNKLEKISDFAVPAVPNGFLTGGEISPDGQRVVICDYLAAYEIKLPANAKNFDAIWQEKPVKINLGERMQGEAIGYSVDGTSFYATSEKRNSPLIRVRRKN